MATDSWLLPAPPLLLLPAAAVVAEFIPIFHAERSQEEEQVKCGGDHQHLPVNHTQLLN